MSYLIQNISPLDLFPSKGIGINIPFNGNTGFNTTYETKDAVRANLLNFLLTGQRERIMNPQLGSTIRNKIFEQIENNTIENIEDIIQNGIISYFPMVKLNELTVNFNNNTILVYIKYSLKNTNIKDDFQINFTNG